MSSGRAAFGFVFASTLMSAISFSIVIPVLPELVRQFTGGDRADAAEWMMLLVSAWGLTQFVFSSLLGNLSDRYGRRPILLLSALGLGIDFLFMAVAPSLVLFLVGRLISGATSASFSTARAYIADVIPERERTAAFGKLASTLSIGFMAGPALGGVMSQHDLRLPFFVAAAMCLANFVVGVAVLRESLPAHRRRSDVSWRIFTFAPIAHGEGLRALLGVSFLVSLANMLWGSVWVLFCGHRFGWSPVDMGLQMMAAGALGVVVQSWLVRPVVKRLGEWRTLWAGLLVTALSLVYAGFAPTGWWFVASMPVAALGLVLAPSLSGLLSARAGPEHQGRVHGVAQSLHGLASVIGPPLFGAVFAWSLRQHVGVDLSPLAVFLSAGILFVALVLAIVPMRSAVRRQ
jgi:MFS transporter, DHA1 family, tetracycline resistance protein